jgi:hypothetical protein
MDKFQKHSNPKCKPSPESFSMYLQQFIYQESKFIYPRFGQNVGRGGGGREWFD